VYDLCISNGKEQGLSWVKGYAVSRGWHMDEIEKIYAENGKDILYMICRASFHPGL
jgi:hypothetical protein